MVKVTLNKNELAVFKECLEDASMNGYDFGFVDDIRVEGLSKHQVAGYISSLSTKDAIRITDDEYRQTMINPTFAAAAGLDDYNVEYLREQGYFNEEHQAIEVVLVEK